MSMQNANRAIRTVIEAAKTAWTDYTLKVDYENRDATALADQTNPYLAVDIVWLDGEQLDLGPSPLTEKIGQIVLAVGVKEGAGTDKVLKLLDHLETYLEMKDNIGSGVRTHASVPTKARVFKGFYYQPLIIPFWMVTT